MRRLLLVFLLLPIWSVLASELSNKLDRLTPMVQVSDPDAYSELVELTPAISQASPSLQIRWYVLYCNAALSSESLETVQQIRQKGLLLASRVKGGQLPPYLDACEADKLRLLGRYDEALTLVDESLQKYQSASALSVNLLKKAEILADTGELQAALDNIYQAITWLESDTTQPLYRPHPASISYALARIYFYLGDYLRSDTLFTEATQQIPASTTLGWIIRVNRIYTLMQQQRFQQGRQMMEALQGQLPQIDGDDQAQFHLLYAHLSLKVQDFSKAFNEASFAAEGFADFGMHERQARAWSLMAEAAFEQKQFEQGTLNLGRSRAYYQKVGDQNILTDLLRIEAVGLANQGRYQQAFAVQLAYQQEFAKQQNRMREDALLQQQTQLNQKLEQSRQAFSEQSAQYFEIHSQLLFWQLAAGLSALLWVFLVLFRLSNQTNNNADSHKVTRIHWKDRLEQVLAATDRSLPVVQIQWDSGELSESDKKRILHRDLRAKDILMQPESNRLLLLLPDASEAEGERLRYRISRHLANQGYRQISSGVARSHPLDRADSLLARLECNQIQHSLMHSVTPIAERNQQVMK